jgi:hypothetical protein
MKQKLEKLLPPTVSTAEKASGSVKDEGKP